MYVKFIDLIAPINFFFLMYACALFGLYIGISILSFLEMRKYINKNRYIDYNDLMSFSQLPSVSIIAPAYNEAKTIIENIFCLLSVHYQNFEIIIVNDGSTDNTLEIIIKRFELVKVQQGYDMVLWCEPIKAVYKSKNSAYNHLVILDKENGGKADALNAGINISQKELFLALDVDCIIEPDAVLRMVKPFLDSKEIVIASGGVVRIVNSCEVKDGEITEVNYPENFLARFQIIEYFRAFTMGRMAWSKLNGLLIVSGAFGLFDKKRIIKAGGYDKSSVGEDLELVVRLRRYMHEVEKVKYKVAFIPDPLCWTEVPETYKMLSRQRNRWTRGGIDTILKHRKMFFNPKYGLAGMVSFPYWVFFEWLAPIVQFLGILYFIVITMLGMLDRSVFVLLSIFVFSFSVMYSLFAIFLETYTYNKYRNAKNRLLAFVFIFLEMIIYQPLNMYFSLCGNYDYFFKKNKKGWGEMRRTGFVKSNNTK